MPPQGSKLVENIHFMDLNGEDGGNVGYWALDQLFDRVQIWRVAKVSATFGAPWSDFYVVLWSQGTWTTYPGVPSPNCDAIPAIRPTALPVEQARGSGTVSGWVTLTFSGRVLPGQSFSLQGPIDSAGSPAPASCQKASMATNSTSGPLGLLVPKLLQQPGQLRRYGRAGYGWQIWRYHCQTMVETVSGTTGGNIVVVQR